MYCIKKSDIKKFMDYYHYFNGSCIKLINYNVSSSKISITIDISWAGNAKLKDDGTLDKEGIKMKMIFKGIKQFENKMISSKNVIEKAYLKYIKMGNKFYVCFATDESNPLLYIISDSMEFEEIIELI